VIGSVATSFRETRGAKDGSTGHSAGPSVGRKAQVDHVMD
jgi:hypothetical protein